MLRFLSKRVIQIVILLFIYVTIVFWLMEALPGSFLDKYLMNPKITPEIRENLKRQLDLTNLFYQISVLHEEFLSLGHGGLILLFSKASHLHNL